MGAKRPVITERAQRAESRRERSDRRRFLHLGRLGGHTMGPSIARPTVVPLGATVPHILPGATYNRAQYPAPIVNEGHNTRRPGSTWGARCAAGALTCPGCPEVFTTSHSWRGPLDMVGVVPMPSASIVGSVALCLGHSGNRATCPYWKEDVRNCIHGSRS